MDRAQKRDFVASLAKVFADTSMVVVTHYQGLTVAQVTDLRRRMRGAGATFRVAKNRLAVRALEGTRFEGIRPMLTGPTALAWSADPVSVARTAIEFSRTNDKLVVIGGSLGTRTLNASEVQGTRGVAAFGDATGTDRGADPRPRDAHSRDAPGAGRTACPRFRCLRQGRCRRGRGAAGRVKRQPDGRGCTNLRARQCNALA